VPLRDPHESCYRARYYDPIVGRFTREDPLRFGAWDTNFYSYVSQNPANYTDPSGRVRIYGNWCGPKWTGGMREPFDPAHAGLYKNPVDGVDEACMHHDICYFNCRSQLPCAVDARQNCMRNCDKLLLAEMPINKWPTIDPVGIAIWWGIASNLHPNPWSNEACGCKPPKPVNLPNISGGPWPSKVYF